MKNKKAVIIILSIVLAISAIGCLASFTLLKHEVTRNTELQFVLRPDADKTKLSRSMKFPPRRQSRKKPKSRKKRAPRSNMNPPKTPDPALTSPVRSSSRRTARSSATSTLKKPTVQALTSTLTVITTSICIPPTATLSVFAAIP